MDAGLPQAVRVTAAALEAFLTEVRAAGAAAELETTRLALVLSPNRRSELSRRIGELLDEYAMRDDPDGEPWAIFVAQHRRPG